LLALRTVAVSPAKSRACLRKKNTRPAFRPSFRVFRVFRGENRL